MQHCNAANVHSRLCSAVHSIGNIYPFWKTLHLTSNNKLSCNYCYDGRCVLYDLCMVECDHAFLLITAIMWYTELYSSNCLQTRRHKFIHISRRFSQWCLESADTSLCKCTFPFSRSCASLLIIKTVLISCVKQGQIISMLFTPLTNGRQCTHYVTYL